MSDETIEAILSIEINVTCPNEDCGRYLNLLNEIDTDGTMHDDDGSLLRQVFPNHGTHDDFECDEVVCTHCKTEFNVKGLEW